VALFLTGRRARWQSAALAQQKMRDLRLFCCGNFVSQCGDQFQIVGLAVLVLNRTHDPAMLGTVLVARAYIYQAPTAACQSGIVRERCAASAE